jgi:hypothetical protein
MFVISKTLKPEKHIQRFGNALIMQGNTHIVFHAKIAKEPYILKSPGNTQAV